MNHNLQHFNIQNRRYIGSKSSLVDWIFEIMQKECKGESFLDLFAGTGIVANRAFDYYKSVFINDILDSNYIIYKAFFGKDSFRQDKLNKIEISFKKILSVGINENYFSEHYGNKYYSLDDAKTIGEIREQIEELFIVNEINKREYCILIASLLYSMDKTANTVGHYESFLKNILLEDRFTFRLIAPSNRKAEKIFQEDANELVKNISTDVVYIDPPYNSRQYSRFYHLLDNVATWKKPEVFGTALKPVPTNLSEYCRAGAANAFKDLIENISARYIVVSYNNTYESKSSSSANKMTLEQISEILGHKGKTSIFEKSHKHFNAGKTSFSNHKEMLFITEVNDD